MLLGTPIIYYHVLCYNEWKSLVQEQLLQMYSSGLLETCHSLNVYLSRGDNSDYRWLDSQIQGIPNSRCYHHPEDVWGMEERATLLKLHEDCRNRTTNDFPVFYIHTKGLTRGGYNVTLWRLFMEHYNVTKWKCATFALESYNAYGVNLRDDTEEYFGGRFLHYSGNFWWSKSSYIKTLDRSYIEDTTDRWRAEFWLGTKGSREAFYNAKESGVDHYKEPFELSNYMLINKLDM